MHLINQIKQIKQIIQSQKLNIDFNLPDDSLIKEFQDKVNWSDISMYQKLSEEFIEKFQDKVNWHHISANQNLSENFIEKFQDKVTWFHIGMYQKLSEKFIEKFQDNFHWYYISSSQKLSEEFIVKNWNKLHHRKIIIDQESLTPAFLCWLYRTYQEDEYNWLKYKNNDFEEHAKKIEEEVKIVMIEFM